MIETPSTFKKVLGEFILDFNHAKHYPFQS